MKRLLYYAPALLLLAVILFIESGWVKITLGVILAVIVLFAKKRRINQHDEIEVDERVKTNIHYYSFSFIIVLNSLLVCYFLMVAKFDLEPFMTTEYLLIYLLVSIIVPLYIIPSIAKRL